MKQIVIPADNDIVRAKSPALPAFRSITSPIGLSFAAYPTASCGDPIGPLPRASNFGKILGSSDIKKGSSPVERGRSGSRGNQTSDE